ncbi:MAG TPA: hypothetical protein VGP65_17885 [Candidatus Angelobacter sp.]|jgi:hypothetical protein|nr:hypothetical protein [Candidatus Angelobacter sp.]
MAKDQSSCRFAGKKITRNISPGFVLLLSPTNGSSGEGCRAKLIDSNKRAVFSTADWDIAYVQSKEDVNGDGIPDLVLEGFSGGAHCCWTYYVVSLGATPSLLKKFENERGAGFVRNKSTGRIEIATMDGAFDYFDFLSHGETPFPDVYLSLEGKLLSDISKTHVADYDLEIKKARTQLDSKTVSQFRSVATMHDLASGDFNRHTASIVLQIVFAYLYSGRKELAHRAVKEMWPVFDQERIWKLILETRRKGILRYTAK